MLVSLIYLVSYFFSTIESVSDDSRIMAFVLIVLLYDPIFTSIFGGTIGHMNVGIKVKREKNQMKNIIFPLAIIRFLTKILLGWVSLLTILLNKKRKAIHDYIVGSVVLYQ